MQFITEWVTNIILLILLATILELLLPNSTMQRYVKMVVSLLIIVLILHPLLSLFNSDVHELINTSNWPEEVSQQQVGNSIEQKKTEIESGQRAYISEQVAVQMKQQVEEELRSQFGVELKTMAVSLDAFSWDNYDQANIREISLVLKHEETDLKHEEAVESVPVVVIDTGHQIEKEESFAEHSITTFLAREWQLSEDQLLVSWEGGGTKQ